MGLRSSSGHEEVHQAPADRRDEQADQVVDEEAGDRRAGRAGDPELRQVVAHEVDQTGPGEGGEEVPQADVQALLAGAQDRRREVHDHEHQPDQDERVDEDRRLAPLDRLPVSGQLADDGGGHEELPGAEDDPAELVREDRLPGQARDGEQHAGDERVGDEPVGRHVGVDHADAARRQPLDALERIQVVELHRVRQPAEQRDAEEDRAGDEVPADEIEIDQRTPIDGGNHRCGSFTSSA